MDMDADGNAPVLQKRATPDRMADAKILSELTPKQINAVFDAIDGNRDQGLSPVRAYRMVLQYLSLQPNSLPVFFAGGIARGN